MARESPPPYQLLPGDPFNLTLGVLVASLLAACKRVPGLAPLVQVATRRSLPPAARQLLSLIHI